MTASTTVYASESDFRRYIRDDTIEDTDTIDSVLISASRTVDALCDRHFYQTTATTRYLSPSSGPWLLRLGYDLASSSGLVVTSSFANNGTYPDTWTLNTDFILEPVNGIVGGVEGWPYTALRSVGGRIWPPRPLGSFRDTVKIVGVWGWPSIPEPVKQATLILAVDLYKLGDAPFGFAGIGDYGAVRVRDNPRAVALLQPYRKADTLLMV